MRFRLHRFARSRLCVIIFSFHSGRLLTRKSVVSLLRDAVRQAGLPYSSLKGHSFRIGATSTAAAAAAGLPILVD